MRFVTRRAAPFGGLLGVKRFRSFESFLHLTMAGETDATLLGADKSLNFRGVRRMAVGALPGGHRCMDALFFEHLRHLRVAGETKVFARQVGFPGIASRHLMAAAAAPLRERLVRNGFDHALVIRAVRAVALFARGLIHGKGRMGALDLRRAEVVASEANLCGCALQQRWFGGGVGAVAQ